MALGLQPKMDTNTNWKTPDENIYEAHILSKPEEILNPFYNPDEDAPSKKFQLKWEIVLDEADIVAQNGELGEDEKYSSKITYFTGTNIGTHAKNKLTNLVKVLDKEFDITKGYASEEDFYGKVVGAPLRVVVAHKVVNKDGEQRTYLNVGALMKSNKPRASVADMLKAQTGASSVEEEIPF